MLVQARTFDEHGLSRQSIAIIDDRYRYTSPPGSAERMSASRTLGLQGKADEIYRVVNPSGGNAGAQAIHTLYNSPAIGVDATVSNNFSQKGTFAKCEEITVVGSARTASY